MRDSEANKAKARHPIRRKFMCRVFRSLFIIVVSLIFVRFEDLQVVKQLCLPPYLFNYPPKCILFVFFFAFL